MLIPYTAPPIADLPVFQCEQAHCWFSLRVFHSVFRRIFHPALYLGIRGTLNVEVGTIGVLPNRGADKRLNLYLNTAAAAPELKYLFSDIQYCTF